MLACDGCSRRNWISGTCEFLKLFVADPKYLACVDGWYEALAQQLTGLYHKDGGPIVMAQVPNHMLPNHYQLNSNLHSILNWFPVNGSTFAYRINCKANRDTETQHRWGITG